MHRISQLHSGFIHSLEYCCCLDDQSRENTFEECIYSVGNCIEKLLLQLSSNFSFHWRVLSRMPSLKYFKLTHCSLPLNLNSHFNSLISLSLSAVRVLAGSLESILPNCLSLCSLLIRECELPSKLLFRGSNLQLKCILICDSKGVEEIELYASNLITFEFIGLEISNIIFDYAPQLQSVGLSLFSDPMYYCQRLGKDLPRLKSLLLDIPEYIYQESSIPVGIISTFSNLQRLVLTLFLGEKINLFSLTPLLHNSPLLQEFHLAIMNSKCVGPQLEKHVIVHSQLKKVDISGFNGSENQNGFVAYLLKSCVELQHMYIIFYCNLYFGFGEWEEAIVSHGFCEKVYEDLKQLKHQPVSKAVQLIYQEKMSRIKVETIY